MSKIAPCLWFNGQAEQAARLYTSTFPNSRIDKVVPAAADNPSTREDETLTVEFTLDGTRLIGLNGGPDFTFSEAISLSIECEDQAEVDRYWEALVQGGGSHSVCGWLKDRFGLSWQVIPKALPQMLMDENSEKAQRVMRSMLQMHKIDLAALERAQAA